MIDWPGRHVLPLVTGKAVDVEAGECASQVGGVARFARYLHVGARQRKVGLHVQPDTGDIGKRVGVVTAYAVIREVSQVNVHVARAAAELGDLRLIEAQLEVTAGADGLFVLPVEAEGAVLVVVELRLGLDRSPTLRSVASTAVQAHISVRPESTVALRTTIGRCGAQQDKTE